MRYAVIGAAGQLGRDLCPRLDGDVHRWGRAEADLTDRDRLRSSLVAARPDAVINCAAYNFVDRAEAECDAAFAVNAWGVRNLAEACREVDATLVHFSTNFVFGLDDSRRTPYAEADAAGPIGIYGLSKLSGEYLVRALCPRHFVIRTCGLFGVWGSGGKGGNFVETMLRNATFGKPLTVVSDQVCTPSYAADVASATVALLRSAPFGLYHLTNGGSCSWYEFARAIFARAGLEVNLSPIPSSALGAAARRPAYSVLGRPAADALGLPPLRDWQEALGAYLEERQQKRGA